MIASGSIPSLNARPVLERLQHLIDLVEGSSILNVTAVTVDLLTTTGRSMGAGTPELQVLAIPRDLPGGELVCADTQRLTFTLKRSTAFPNPADTDGQLQQAAEVITAGLRALAPLRDEFTTTARMEFQFELTDEGKFDFFIRPGARALDAHRLTLAVKFRSQPTTPPDGRGPDSAGDPTRAETQGRAANIVRRYSRR
ncbi:hypothetical protein [Deinococcus aestuarii]|uniref:hypothetical protein n=1 Tax=Deinococcus aestuarii TaxID=2774531 RepID=UPI001C0D4BF9|nr:hypothetical protein [Deinococcus aestuarii]